MVKLYSPTKVKEIINKHGIKMSKSLGQNFLVDGNIVDKIIGAAGLTEGDLVIEIGPGLGVLTEFAAKKAHMVLAVEIDAKLIPALEENLSGHNNIKIINEDFLKCNLAKLIDIAEQWNKGSFSGVKLIGNLPYYITSPIIMKILEDQVGPSNVQSITVMVQKEVGERIKAGPGTKAYGVLSIAIQYYCTVDLVSTVSKSVFIPKPKVDSVVLNLKIRNKPAVDVIDTGTFFMLVKAAFGQRRKTLLNSLTGFRGMDKHEIANILQVAGIDSVRRAETLSLEEFASISRQIV